MRSLLFLRLPKNLKLSDIQAKKMEKTGFEVPFSLKKNIKRELIPLAILNEINNCHFVSFIKPVRCRKNFIKNYLLIGSNFELDL